MNEDKIRAEMLEKIEKACNSLQLIHFDKIKALFDSRETEAPANARKQEPEKADISASRPEKITVSKEAEKDVREFFKEEIKEAKQNTKKEMLEMLEKLIKKYTSKDMENDEIINYNDLHSFKKEIKAMFCKGEKYDE